MKTLVLTMSFLMCLNCSVKREFKQAFDIPVSNTQHPEKPGSTPGVCQFLIMQEGRERIVAVAGKGIKKHHDGPGSFFLPAEASVHPVHPFAESVSPASVPIYILHRQFLI